jgi:hypothetical protein
MAKDQNPFDYQADPLMEQLEQGINPFSGTPVQKDDGMFAVRPRYNFPGLEPLGRHDDQLMYGMDQEAVRGFNQPVGHKWVNGLISRGLSIGTKIGQGMGHVSGLASAAISGDINDIWDNAIANAFAEMDESLREQFPVHKQRQYLEGNLLAKLGTPEFWADDFFDGVAFLASAYVPGAVAGAAIKGVSAISTATKFANGLKKFGLGAVRTTSTVYNTVSEAGFEAKDIFDNLQLEYQELGLSPEEAKIKASEAAARVFRANLVGLIAPNAFQSKYMHLGDKNITSAIRRAARGDKSVTQAAKEFASPLKAVAQGIISEGFWEENFQEAVQAYEHGLVKGTMSEDYLKEYAGLLAQGVEAFGETFSPFHKAPKAGSVKDQQATAIFLGALLGGGMTGIQSFKERAQYADAIESERGRWKDVMTVHGRAKQLFIDNYKATLKPFGTEIVEKEDGTKTEITKYVDQDGNVIIDPEKQALQFLRLGRDATLGQINIEAGVHNNKHLLAFNQEMAMASYAWHLKTIPNATQEDLDELIENDIRLAVEEQSREDGIPADLLEKNIETIKGYLTEFDSLQSAVADVKDFSDDKHDQMFQNVLRRTGFYHKAKINAFNKLREKTTNPTMLEAIDQSIEMEQKALDELVSNREELYEDFKSTIIDVLEIGRRLGEIEDTLKEISQEGTTTPEALEELYKEKAKLHHFLEEHQKINNFYVDSLFEGSEYFSSSIKNAEARNNTTRPLSLKENFYYARGMSELTSPIFKDMLPDPEGELSLEDIQAAIQFRNANMQETFFKRRSFK